MTSIRDAMDTGIAGEEEEILRFVDYAKSTFSDEFRPEGIQESEAENFGPAWGWVFSRILKTCTVYSSGVTSAILLSDLFLAWKEQNMSRSLNNVREFKFVKKSHNRERLPKTVTIDSIYDKKFISLDSILEAVVVDEYLLPGTDIHVLRLGDGWSSNTIDLYLHRKFYDLVNPIYGLLKKGREVFLTGCYLRTPTEECGHPRLLPTEYLVILLDENNDEDALLLGAQFCSDSFCSLSSEASEHGTAYSLYAREHPYPRIKEVGQLEILGKFGGVKRRQIILVDKEGYELKFLLWGEQILLANLFSVGSMLALDRPFVANASESNIQTTWDVCLEYGSATQLYLVPFQQPGEQVTVCTQNRIRQTEESHAFRHSQDIKVSQVTLPCDFQGSIDFSSYPSRLLVDDLHDKLNHVCLYGVVKNIHRVTDASSATFSMKIGDATGSIVARLHFIRCWSIGRLSIGHTIFISGMACSKGPNKTLEASWFEKDAGASLVNLSCLPTLLNSACLHKLSCLSELSCQSNITHICKVWIAQIELQHVTPRFLHSVCGQFVNRGSNGVLECAFCQCCPHEGEPEHAFQLLVTLGDESGKVFSHCSGYAAAELLQISADEFSTLPTDEKAMYLYTLQNEQFMVAMVHSTGYDDDQLRDDLEREIDAADWEIVRALKCN